jgi:hypothetical protein
MSNDGLLVEGVGIVVLEDGSWRNERVGYSFADGSACAEFDA